MRKLPIPELLKDCSEYNTMSMKYGFTEGVPDSLRLVSDAFVGSLRPLQISRGSEAWGMDTFGGFVQIYRRNIL